MDKAKIKAPIQRPEITSSTLSQRDKPTPAAKPTVQIGHIKLISNDKTKNTTTHLIHFKQKAINKQTEENTSHLTRISEHYMIKTANK